MYHEGIRQRPPNCDTIYWAPFKTRKPFGQQTVVSSTLVPELRIEATANYARIDIELLSARNGNKDVAHNHILGLPAELRVRIYEHLFSTLRQCQIAFYASPPTIHWAPNGEVSTGLLRTCRAIYRAARA